MEAYRQGKDLYSEMASKIFNMPLDECKEFRADGTLNPEGKDRRSMVKSVLLGIMYSRGAKSIADQFGKSVKWAEELVDNFYASYPKVKELQAKVIYQAETLGYVTTLVGTKRRLPDMKLKRDSWEYMNAYRQCLNAVIQGTSAYIMKMAMINLYIHPKYKELGIEMLMTIHDELICEVPLENVKEGKELIESVMRQTGYDFLKLPMKVDCEVTKYWYGQNIEI